MNNTRKRNLLVVILAVLLTAAVVLLVPTALTQEAHANGSDPEHAYNSDTSNTSNTSNTSDTSNTSNSSNPDSSPSTSTYIPQYDGMVNGTAMTWEEIAEYILSKLEGDHAYIELNNAFDVPTIIQQAAKTRNVDVTFIVDETRTWFLDADAIETPENMDLRIALIASIKTKTPRGVRGKQFMLDGTGSKNVELFIDFGSDYVGQFANIYKMDGEALLYVKSVKVGENGDCGLGIHDKGDYLAMLCEYSDLSGDANNDGVLTPADASAILKSAVGAADAPNAAMTDFNNDGAPTPADASAILKALVA